MERFVRTLVIKAFTVLFAITLCVSCITPQHTVQITDYVLLENGKQVLGREKGLTAFIFENNQRKVPFVQFVSDKYNLGTYTELEYWVDYEGYRFKIMVYDNAELEKYFNTSQFMISTVETEANKLTNINFIALSVINDKNEDCLANGSLYQNIAIKYLKELKAEYLN